MKKHFWQLCTLIGVVSALQSASATVLFSHDFETPGGYTLGAGSEHITAANDYFSRTDGSSPVSIADDPSSFLDDGSYNDQRGAFSGDTDSANSSAFFFAAEDQDCCAGVTAPNTLTFSQFSVSGHANVTFGGWFAAGSSGSGAPSYELDDFIRVFIDFDGGGYNKILGFEAPNNVASNQHLHQDVDLDVDTLGEGAQLNDRFQYFASNPIATGGATNATIRIELDAGATSEELAFDNIAVIPEPSSALLLLLGSFGLLIRRR